jgi:hypothetical protein
MARPLTPQEPGLFEPMQRLKSSMNLRGQGLFPVARAVFLVSMRIKHDEN